MKVKFYDSVYRGETGTSNYTNSFFEWIYLLIQSEIKMAARSGHSEFEIITFRFVFHSS